MDELWSAIAAKTRRLNELRPLSPRAIAKLEHYYDIELTWAVAPAFGANVAGRVGIAPGKLRGRSMHYQFVQVDGNSLTARLLMNLILIRGGYPPVAVRPEDRLEYVRNLQREQAGRGADAFYALLHKQLDQTLDEYLSALQEAHMGYRG